jgi:hypothetical protein
VPDIRESHEKPSARFDRYDASLLFGFALYLYAILFAAPGTPFLLGGDQVFFWMDGQRLLDGEQVYRDFFRFTPPGTDLLYLSVFKLLGPRIWTPNLTVLVLGISLCWLCLRISRSIMPRSQAVLATSLFLVFVYGQLLNGTHHFFSVLAVLGAVALLMEARTPVRIATAGALLGVATFITQTRGPVAAVAIAAWLTWDRSRTDEPWSIPLRQQMLLFASLIVTWLALSSYYIATIGLRQLWFFQVTYVRHYMAPWSLELPRTLSRETLPAVIEALFAYGVLPAVYATCLWKCWRLPRGAWPDNIARVALLTAVGTAMFAEVAQSPSWFRLYCVAAPGAILLVWLVGRIGPFTGYATRLMWVGIVGLAAHQAWSGHRTYSSVRDLPAGRVAMAPVAAEKLTWLAAHTKPGQFMLQAGWPGMYLPLGLRCPTYLQTLETGGQGPLGYVALSMRQLEARHVQYIVWSPRLDTPEYSLTAFRSLAPFREFLKEQYQRVWTFSDHDEIWERKPEVVDRNSTIPPAGAIL